MILPLSEATLHRHGERVDIPRYVRDALTPAVLHMSVGAFHRSHQAVYFDALARSGNTDWGVVGVGLHRPEMRDVLAAQDGLYTVVSRGAMGSSALVVGVITRYLFAPAHTEAVFETIADPRIRLITLTITGPAYKLAADGGFDAEDPEIAADLADPLRPLSALGFLVEGLDRRRRAGMPGLTVLSCDNLPGNGAIAQAAVVGLARMRDPALAGWIEEQVSFPSSMVDRITPQTTVADRDAIAAEFGVADRWPVVTEPFSHWVIEDRFSGPRPPLDEVGVRFVDDVRPYSLMKTRLLNGSHFALGVLGTLAGHRRIDEAMGDPVFAAYADTLLRQVTPLIGPVGGVDLAAYRQTLLERFANPHIADRLSRLCRNGSAKLTAHIVPSILTARDAGLPHDALVLAVAGWIRHLRGCDDRGDRFTIDDPRAERMAELAPGATGDVREMLRSSGLFGALTHDRGFADDLRAALAALELDGVRAVLLTGTAAGR